MIKIDSHESEEYDFWIGRSGVYWERENINQLPGKEDILPDFVLYNGGRVVGVNHKQAGELLGSIDKVEEQLLREIRGDVDNIILMIDGVITVNSDGSCMSWKKEQIAYRTRNKSTGAWNRTESISECFIPQHEFGNSYIGVVSFFTRLWELGIPVVRTNGVVESCTEMVAIHNSMGKEEWQHKTFERFIKDKYSITQQDKKKRDLILTLMGISNAKIGEEAGNAIAGQFETFWDMQKFMLRQGGNIGNIYLPRRVDDSRPPRKVGQALDTRLRESLGMPGIKYKKMNRG